MKTRSRSTAAISMHLLRHVNRSRSCLPAGGGRIAAADCVPVGARVTPGEYEVADVRVSVLDVVP